MMKILRWVLVPPAAVAGSLLAMFLYGLITMIGNWGFGMDSDAPFNRLYQLALSGFAGGYAAVWAGAFTAPTHRKVTAITITVVVLMVCGAGVFAAILRKNWWSIYQAVFIVVGAIYAGRSAHDGDLAGLEESRVATVGP
jgi:hypothetical protein